GPTKERQAPCNPVLYQDRRIRPVNPGHGGVGPAVRRGGSGLLQELNYNKTSRPPYIMTV
ncbi:hypothetical protein BaRGS_00039413, partial [Batillaria attramentaria]